MFRDEALEHFRNRQEASILPQLARPSARRFLWAFAVLAVLGTLIVLWMPLPTYVVVDGRVLPAAPPSDASGSPSGSAPPLTLAVQVSAEKRSDLTVGQSVFLENPNLPIRTFRIADVSSQARSPVSLASRYALELPDVDEGPAYLLHVTPIGDTPVSLASLAGTETQVRIEVGTTRLYHVFGRYLSRAL